MAEKDREGRKKDLIFKPNAFISDRKLYGRKIILSL